MVDAIKDFLGFDIKSERYALVDDKMFGKISKEKKPDKWIRSTCGYCGVGCGLYIGVKDNKPVYTKGDPTHPVNMGTLCPKGLTQHEMVGAASRLTSPMIRKNDKLVSVSWDEAFLKVSEKFKDIASLHGKNAVACISSGQLLTEEFYTLGKFIQLGLGTNNYDGNTTLCMSSAIMGYKQSFGSDGPPGCYEDFSYADVIFLFGSNLADNHPIIKLHIEKNSDKTLIVVDPRHSKTANIADIFVPIKSRTDLALINGLCHIIWQEGLADEKFMQEKVNKSEEFIKHIQIYTPKIVSGITGIEIKELYNLANIYAKANRALCAWTMGINQSTMGSDTISAICNLALMCGNIGKRGASAFSLTGQCNAMGTREVGFTSSIPGYRDFTNLKDRREYAEIVNVPLELVPKNRGYSYPQIIEAIEKGEIKALWIVGTNPLVSFSNQNRIREAFKKLEILVVQDSFLSDTASFADVVFSAATWSEKEGTYTNSERRCNLARKSIEAPKDCKSDFYIVTEFSKYFEGVNKMLFDGWSSHLDAFDEWKKVSSGRLCDYSGMSYEKIEKLGGIQWPCNKQNPNGTKRLYNENISCRTPDGKPRFISSHWKPLEENISKEFPFILNTGRTVEHFHTATKTKTIKILNDLAPEAWVEINPKDAKKLKVKSGDRVTISSVRGEVENIIVKVTGIVREENIFVPFHFNKQLINRLTLSTYDPKSFTPNFKQCAVQIKVTNS